MAEPLLLAGARVERLVHDPRPARRRRPTTSCPAPSPSRSTPSGGRSRASTASRPSRSPRSRPSRPASTAGSTPRSRSRTRRRSHEAARRSSRRVDRSVLVTQAGILLLLVQFGVLAGYAVILVAALLLERRRTETALLRARGGGFGHLVSMALGEALLVIVPAVIAAPWRRRCSSRPCGSTRRWRGWGSRRRCPAGARSRSALIGGVLAILALTIPTLLSGVSDRRRRGPRSAGRSGRTLPAAARAGPRARRAGRDRAASSSGCMARRSPAPRAATLGVDPLLVAAPAIGLLAGAVLADPVRPAPRRARGARPRPRPAARARARRRARSRAGRCATRAPRCCSSSPPRSARSPPRTPRPGRGARRDQAAYAAGADVRLTPAAQGAVPPWGLGEALRAVPGVTAATPVEDGSHPARARRSATGRCWASTARRWRTSCASGRMRRARRRSPRSARWAPTRGERTRHPDPRRHAADLARRRFRVRADRGLPAVPRRLRRASASRSCCSTPTAGSRGLRARPVRSSGRRRASRRRSSAPTAPGSRCRPRSSASSSTSRPAATSRSRSRGPWTCGRSRRAPRTTATTWTPLTRSRAAGR